MTARESERPVNYKSGKDNKIMVKGIKKNYRILRELIRVRFQNLMMYRLGFWGPFFVDGSMFAIQLLVFDAIYANVERVGTWERGEMILFIGTFSLIDAVNMVVYFFGAIRIPEKIRGGEMDLYLTKPVSPLFRLTFEQIDPGSVPLVLMSLVILGYGMRAADITVSSQNIIPYGFWVSVMILLYYDMEILIRSASFWLISDTNLIQLEETAIDLCMKIPGTAFYGIYKLIFYCILPYGIMATVPVQSLIGELTLSGAVHGISVVLLFTGITALIWKKGIGNYDSASS